ncbi:MAG: preprotein translocase subunit SecG [Prevotellaceae bacterium]|jgi:preprotein translocase subunit SecG|nr:preprotein translocase subunit SecG [Prevotellaceae bacterium]
MWTYTLFAVLLVVAGILMVGVVLIQNSKGGGLAANFASGNQTFGVRQTADLIEKITWYLIIAMFVFCFAASASIDKNIIVTNRSAVQERMQGEIPGNFPVTGMPSSTDQSSGEPAGETATENVPEPEKSAE